MRSRDRIDLNKERLADLLKRVERLEARKPTMNYWDAAKPDYKSWSLDRQLQYGDTRQIEIETVIREILKHLDVELKYNKGIPASTEIVKFKKGG